MDFRNSHSFLQFQHSYKALPGSIQTNSQFCCVAAKQGLFKRVFLLGK